MVFKLSDITVNAVKDEIATVVVENKEGKSGQIMIQTRDSDATSPEDYHAVKSILTFENGDTSQEVNIPIVKDQFYKID